jgi:hypothetical protein
MQNDQASSESFFKALPMSLRVTLPGAMEGRALSRPRPRLSVALQSRYSFFPVIPTFPYSSIPSEVFALRLGPAD